MSRRCSICGLRARKAAPPRRGCSGPGRTRAATPRSPGRPTPPTRSGATTRPCRSTRGHRTPAFPHLERLNYNAPGPTRRAQHDFGHHRHETEGIFTGYRFFDKQGIEPQFAFGHGLSYTTFEYRNLVFKPEGETMRVSFIVQNKGDVTGTAVPQVYVGPAPNVPDYVQQAVRALRGFATLELRPNEAKRVEITLNARSFQYWDEQSQAWTTAPGVRTIWVGESSPRPAPVGRRCTGKEVSMPGLGGAGRVAPPNLLAHPCGQPGPAADLLNEEVCMTEATG